RRSSIHFVSTLPVRRILRTPSTSAKPSCPDGASSRLADTTLLSLYQPSTLVLSALTAITYGRTALIIPVWIARHLPSGLPPTSVIWKIIGAFPGRISVSTQLLPSIPTRKLGSP